MRMLHARESRVQTRRPSLPAWEEQPLPLCSCVGSRGSLSLFGKKVLDRKGPDDVRTCRPSGGPRTPLEWQNEPETGALPAQGGSRQQEEKASSRHPPRQGPSGTWTLSSRVASGPALNPPPGPAVRSRAAPRLLRSCALASLRTRESPCHTCTLAASLTHTDTHVCTVAPSLTREHTHRYIQHTLARAHSPLSCTHTVTSAHSRHAHQHTQPLTHVHTPHLLSRIRNCSSSPSSALGRQRSAAAPQGLQDRRGADTEALQEDSGIPRTGTHHVRASPWAPTSRASWDPIRGVSKVGSPVLCRDSPPGLAAFASGRGSSPGDPSSQRAWTGFSFPGPSVS